MSQQYSAIIQVQVVNPFVISRHYDATDVNDTALVSYLSQS